MKVGDYTDGKKNNNNNIQNKLKKVRKNGVTRHWDITWWRCQTVACRCPPSHTSSSLWLCDTAQGCKSRLQCILGWNARPARLRESERAVTLSPAHTSEDCLTHTHTPALAFVTLYCICSITSPSTLFTWHEVFGRSYLWVFWLSSSGWSPRWEGLWALDNRTWTLDRQKVTE